MLENYEIDFKMLLIWMMAISAVVYVSYSFVQSPDQVEGNLVISVSDEAPESGQTIDLQVLKGDNIVEASFLRINEEEYSSVSELNYTVPEDTEILVIEAEYEGLNTERVLDVDLGESGSNDNVTEEDKGGDDGKEQSKSDEPADQGEVDDSGSDSQDRDDADQAEDSDEPQDPDYSVELRSPEQSEVFTATESRQIDFEFDVPEGSSYQLRVNDELLDSGSSESGAVQISESVSPGTYEWFVRAVKNQQVFDSETRGFEVFEQASVAIRSNQSDVDGYVLELSFTVENAENYRVIIDSETVDEGSTGLSEFYRHKFDSAGNHRVEVQALKDDEVMASTTETFSSEAPPTAQINWVSSDTFDTTTPETSFEVITSTDYSLIYSINDGASATDYSYWEENNVGQSVEQHSYTPDPISQGTHDYRISVEDGHGTEIGSKEGQFETTAERGLAEVRGMEYVFVDSSESSQLNEDRHSLQIDVKAYEDIELSIMLNESYIVQDREFSGTDITHSEELGDLNSGQDYTVDLTLESLETSKNLTDQLVFTAE
jgi:hypothetical protein